MYEMKTSENKRKFLKNCGFVLSHEPQQIEGISIGTITSMELWELININHIRLYIHFDNTKEPNYCNLYDGDNERDVQYFSERNLMSELRKRGFKEGD